MGPLGAAAWLLLALATSSPSHPGGSIQLAAASSLIARAAQIPLSLPPWIKDAERPAVGHASGVEGVAASYLDSVSRAVGQEERVLRIQVPDDALQAEQLMRELEEHGFDIWKASKQHVDVRVTSSDDADATLAAHADRMQVLIPSIADLMRNEHTSQAAQLSALAAASLRTHDQHIGAPDTGVHSIYHPLSGIESLLQLFASDFPDFARLEEIGKSPEGKSVYVLSVSDYRASHADLAEGDEEHRSWREYSRSALKQMEREAAASFSKPAKKGKGNKRKIKKLGFSLLGGQHAREWISPATLLYVAHSLLVSAAAGDDETVLTALQDFEFHFVPVINPDGYEYSWTHDRLWVKNRQYTSSNDTRCHGIDLNRNWAYKFGKSYRPNPCSDLYPGEKPFEADELRILGDWLRKTKKEKDLHAFLDVHSFGQMLMYPYSYSCSVVPPDAENLNESLLGASKAIRGVHRLNYEVGSVCDVSYTATGQSLDWTYHEIGVKWSFSINLRDQGVYGFLLPPDQIVPSGQETLAGLLDLAMFIAKKEKIED